MPPRNVLLSALALLLGAAALPPADAGAVPAFARRYKMSCTTCHAPFPRLKDYGDEFAGAGFVIPEEEKERDYVSEGDDLLWLNRVFQLGMRLDAYGVWEGDADVETDLQTPWGLKLLSGGALAKGISYYFYFYMSERGEVAGVEDAYVHFDDVGGAPLDVMVGHFQVCDPLMKRELRLTFEDYQIYKEKIGGSGTNLAYDRGVMLAYGIEETGTDLVAMVVNGNGKDEAGDDHRFDDDKYKNAGLRLAQGLGDVASVGGFVYYGKEREADTGNANEILYWGPDVVIGYGPVTLTAQYLLRTDTNPDFADTEPDEEIETAGIVAELVFGPQGEDGRHWITLLYNRIDSDLDGEDYESVTASFGYLLARNLRLMAEYTRDVENEANRAVIGFVSGF
ncbi:MAG: hypothetical protein JW819_10550 [Candidatus Krumholzibacteriota bacterium]|nr:hypothetical protein [Candidatus Krumholzibacteriota bacterium]